MASRTYNRAPLSVPTPSKGDINEYYFNHVNWKGVNTDKNFLTVDQETFADAKNVYVDGEGILKSRPAIKRSDNRTNILDFWEFDEVKVTFTKGTTKNLLSFDQVGSQILGTSDDNPQLVPYGDKIFIFAKDYNRDAIVGGQLINLFADSKLVYYDKTHKNFFNANDRIYIPKTKVDSAGVETEVESPNLFTNKSIKTYLYNKGTGISPDAYGKDFSLELDDKTYNLTWDYDTGYTIVDSKFKVTDDHLIDIRNDGAIARFDLSNRTLTYSVTGNSFVNVAVLPAEYGDLIDKPKFTQDGRHIIVPTTISFYIITVVPIEGAYEFSEFTDILALNNVGSKWNPDDAFVAYDFISYDNFVYAYKSNVPSGSISVKAIIVVRYDANAEQPAMSKIIYDRSLGDYDSPISTDDYSAEPVAISYNVNTLIQDINAEKGIIAIGSGRDLNNKYHIYLIPSVTMNSVYDANISDKGSNIDILATQSDIRWASSNAYGKIYYDKVDGYPVIESTEVKASGSAVLSSNGRNALYSTGIYFSDTDKFLPLVVTSANDRPIAFTDHIYYLNDQNRLLTGNTERTFELEYAIDGEYHLPENFKWSQLSEFYFAIDNNLYISEYREDSDGRFMWYFPKRNHHEFDSKVTGLIPISSAEMGVFLKDSLWYVSKAESVYTVTKSKLELGVKDGADVITSYDGTLTIFCTDRGMVALSYQDFVASTDQSLTFLSDPIYDKIKDFCKNPVKLYKYDFWVLLYRVDSTDGFIFDTRNGSWWPVSCSNAFSKIIKYKDNAILLSDGKQYHLDKDVDAYFDYDGGKSTIDWFVTSQKLHLSAINNYKHLSNITLSSMIDVTNPNDPVTYDMDVTNYRKTVDDGQTKTIVYKVDMLRTYVQRLNYPKVNEFQYTLRTDYDNKVQRPLSLTNITLKYKITGQVR